MPMPGTTPPFVIPVLLAAGVALVVAFGPPVEEPRAAAGSGHPVTLHLPAATYDALSRQGGGMPGIQERATRMLVEATGR